MTPSAELVRTGLRYDLQAGQFILPNGLRVKVPTPLHGVLSAMMTKQPGRQAGFVSNLSYLAVAGAFERACLEDLDPGMTEAERGKRMQTRRKDIEQNAVKIAQAFRRRLGKWLKRQGIDPKAVVRCSKKGGYYYLGPGWDRKKIVLDDAEVRCVPGGKEHEDQEAFRRWKDGPDDAGAGDGQNDGDGEALVDGDGD